MSPSDTPVILTTAGYTCIYYYYMMHNSQIFIHYIWWITVRYLYMIYDGYKQSDIYAWYLMDNGQIFIQNIHYYTVWWITDRSTVIQWEVMSIALNDSTSRWDLKQGYIMMVSQAVDYKTIIWRCHE